MYIYISIHTHAHTHTRTYTHIHTYIPGKVGFGSFSEIVACVAPMEVRYSGTPPAEKVRENIPAICIYMQIYVCSCFHQFRVHEGCTNSIWWGSAHSFLPLCAHIQINSQNLRHMSNHQNVHRMYTQFWQLKVCTTSMHVQK